MKKKVILFAIATILSAFVFSSCQSTSHCPAYSQADVEQADNNA